MRNFLVLFVICALCSCAKAPLSKKTCVHEELTTNLDGVRLPTAISYTMPSSWLKTPSTNSMKLEERIIDPITQSKMKVFYFEGMKGMTQANLERWQGQFAAQGRELLSQQVLEKNEIPIVEFMMSGTYKDKLQPMNPQSEVNLRPKHTMKAYIVETQTGTWFFKAVAPDAVITKLEAQFNSLISSIKES